jgi:hypothetical protein
VKIGADKVMLGKIGAGNIGNFTATDDPEILRRRSTRALQQ